MINPNEVNLIIFDMDGTIIPSLPIIYEAIRKAFTKLGWSVNFSAEDINKFFGLPSASTSGSGLYQFITPAESHLTWMEIREKVRDEYDTSFREFASVFPGVRETLVTLRKRGYRLVLYSNASIRYFDIVISALGIRECFDYVECIQENNLTKPELVRKIKDRFNCPVAAVVGDRIHDIEAARETSSLSVGILFGYGGKEPEQADMTIGRFDELLSIFDRRLPIFEKILGEIERKKPPDRPLIVGITGIDSSGKTMFTAALADFLVSRNRRVQTISLDDFHNPREIRYAGGNQADSYYHRSFNINAIIEDLLIPIRQKVEHSVTLTLLDLPADKYKTKKEYSFTRETIVLFEGVFLFRKELSPYIDYKISLDISFAESKKRAIARDSAEVFNKYDGKYLPAQAKYLEEYPHEKVADMIIDNTEWERPTVRYSR